MPVQNGALNYHFRKINTGQIFITSMWINCKNIISLWMDSQGSCDGRSYKSRIKICIECGKEFIPASHGGTKQFCSYSCSNTHKWKTRERKPIRILIKICIQCGKEYEKSNKYSLSQWNTNKFCSPTCSGLAKRKNDGLTKYQRSAKKNGSKKRSSPEWIELITARTKEGMLRPEVKEKMCQPHGEMSLDARLAISNALVGKMPKNLAYSNHYPNVKRGDYECSKGTVYFRSMWEANYALFLDLLIKNGEIKNWEYEADVFVFDQINFGTRSYLPDFKIFNKDGTIEYHEVKGYMDSKSLTKLKRMKKYYPEVKLVLIDQAYYRDFYKKFEKILNLY